MAGRFGDAGLDSPRVVAELLLCQVLGCERMDLYMQADRPASQGERDNLRPLVVRVLAGEPVQYVVGRRWFYTRQFEVDRSTMIPQPSTEDLVSAVLSWLGREGSESDGGEDASRRPTVRIADVGTGSGCIAVTLASERPELEVLATDLSEGALALARRNARRHGVAERITFAHGRLLEPVGASAASAGARFDVICSNPPYISDREWEEGQVEASVREYVPAAALRGGSEGLDCIGPLIEGAGGVLRAGGLLALEIGHGQRDAVLELARAAGLQQRRVLKDTDGFWRVLLAETRAD